MIAPRITTGRPRRRGVVLIDAIVGGVMLGIALTALFTISSRALLMQTQGAKRLTAAWLADELLTMVLVEGPDRFPRMHKTHGPFDAPFDEFEFVVDIDSLGRTAPYKVTANVSWDDGQSVSVETIIALRLEEDEEETREPLEPVDRDERWAEQEEEAP
jgi:hypothetical protein